MADDPAGTFGAQESPQRATAQGPKETTPEALVLLREVEQLQATVREWMQAARNAQAEAARWQAQAFQPLGDNHHNAELCPHCNPNGWRLAPMLGDMRNV